MSFGEYIKRVSLGGLLSIATVAALMPLLMRDIWRIQREAARAGAKRSRSNDPASRSFPSRCCSA